MPVQDLPETKACFTDNDPKAVLQRLEVQLGQRIPADGSVLLFLDEIQAEAEWDMHLSGGLISMLTDEIT